MKQGRIVLNQQARRVTALADGKLLLDNGNPLADTSPWLAPATGTVYGVALNHRSLLEQLEADFQQPPYQKAPATPVLFIKPRNTHAGHSSAIALPTQAGKVFAGGALGVVIGKVASKVAEDQALAVLAGYTVVNEISLEESSFYRPAVKAKCRDGFCPMGPWLVDAAAINPLNVEIRSYLNGELAETNHSRDWLRSVPQLIAALSQFMTLQPGDVIIPATPLRQLEIRPGDTVAVEIDGIGRLENRLIAEESAQ
ncbi:fumarylacetoacetate hydrolase family protein [Aquitalea sp. LB_tupeE]|uniref:fumarylacetoacetate hydrolase family protein n=1 Tax=Aquitalea sp. LB_tupeE TaxID=2748078 RepID=UPI0015BBED85|nr:fumarylacetoacetate hydrolase family protein [Aquitalea sp. LB_tupeE]NWK76710.1 fumarylacetoacetate hydrolase family protein [Aquitalea sp. LB_tupeE]